MKVRQTVIPVRTATGVEMICLACRVEHSIAVELLDGETDQPVVEVETER
ncbi:MAG: hypothetical protein WCB68_12530 [Pyrinomonadaceae bacterium]